ncbi:ParA family protein [Halomonas sp. B23F22_10]|uniref:ParA family protein n=1 Tax=Halomonas sp. B23F22_10 TaxID=3459515 RepID=UPI00373F0A5A
MKSVGFFNNKGGVGKTTLICNLAAFLSIKRDKRVLVIDCDPQCNASAYLLPDDQLEEELLRDGRRSIDSIFEPVRRGQGYSRKLPRITRSERFSVDLIVGDPKLSLREDLLATDWADTRNGEPRGFQTTFTIKDLVGRFEGEYDYVLVDMGPSLGALNRSILLGVDCFVMPLSVDIFSLMAIKNVIGSFERWKSDLEQAIGKYYEEEGEGFEVGDEEVSWSLTFSGYVMQQYTAKRKQGERQPVKAFERIRDKQQEEMVSLCEFFDVDPSSASLGEIPILHSIIPLSQQVKAPVFELGAKDGIVGSHYTKVNDSFYIYEKIADNFVRQVGA